jgi:hypothetical protein
MTSTWPGGRTYPLRLDARLDPKMSRWLWLVKPVLAIPHIVVLAVLWVAALCATIAAGVAILATGRYPRRIFDFTVGVLRWTWRVSFYTTGAFGTDRYPPFSLRRDANYPADLDVAYPDSLSRGLVLVKWWLLAIPQYLVVAALTGGWGAGRIGLITVLALVAAAQLLFRGRYSEQLFGLLVGLNRWCFRVAAYAFLLTDSYPPFRLDSGGTDPAAVTVGVVDIGSARRGANA